MDVREIRGLAAVQRNALALLAALLAACGAADEPPEPAPPTQPAARPQVPYGAPICTEVVEGRKVTRYCEEGRT